MQKSREALNCDRPHLRPGLLCEAKKDASAGPRDLEGIRDRYLSEGPHGCMLVAPVPRARHRSISRALPAPNEPFLEELRDRRECEIGCR